MKLQNLNIKEKIGLAFLSMGGTGFSPIAPGTFGSLVSLIYLFFMPQMSLLLNVVIYLVVFIAAVKVTSYFEKKEKIHDPSWIVIDEFLGMVTVNLFFLTSDMKLLALIFVTFRIFDILKPWPVSWADQELNNSFGTIFDDIIAGGYAILLVLLIQNGLGYF